MGASASSQYRVRMQWAFSSPIHQEVLAAPEGNLLQAEHCCNSRWSPPTCILQIDSLGTISQYTFNLKYQYIQTLYFMNREISFFYYMSSDYCPANKHTMLM